MGIRLALVLSGTHYGIGGKEGKTRAATKFISVTPAPPVAARDRTA
jgi:hypothetical protein